jgi:CHAT domain-containing protein
MADMETMRSALQADDYRVSFVEDKQNLYEELFLLSVHSAQPDQFAEAFSYVEKAKSRALVDLLARCVTVRPRDEHDPLFQRLTELRRELSATVQQQNNQVTERGGYLPGHIPDHPDRQTRTRLLESELQDVLRQLRAHDREYVSLQAVETTTLDQVQQDLTPGAVLVEYYFAAGRVQAFVVERDRIRLHCDLAPQAEVVNLLNYFRRLLSKFALGPEYTQTHQQQLEKLARVYLGRLYNHLVRPLAADIAGKSLVIVPHGPLHYLPFHALYTGQQYLIEQSEIRYAPSATVFDFCLQRAVPDSGQALLIGVADPTIPHAVHEVRTIGELLPNAQVRIGEQATTQALRRIGAQSRLIHIASHGLFRPDQPLLSGVRLADGWLTLGEVYTLRLQAALVTLSACQTGLSQVTGGDELIGLARGFLYAGAASLIVSLWAVTDESTADLMSDFYTAWRAGQPAAAALRTAQIAALRRDSHPYYWAPFASVGQ